MKITVEREVRAPIAEVWRAWTTPADIMAWNAASDDWHTTRAEVDLRPGGRFVSRMEAKDGSFGFDFEGTYSDVVAPTLLAYAMDDGRVVRVDFEDAGGSTRVRETFDADASHSVDQQRDGWQAILDNFARHVEARTA